MTVRSVVQMKLELRCCPDRGDHLFCFEGVGRVVVDEVVEKVVNPLHSQCGLRHVEYQRRRGASGQGVVAVVSACASA